MIMLRVKREKNRPVSSITIYKISEKNIKNSNHVGDRAYTEQIECKKRMFLGKRTNELRGQDGRCKKTKLHAPP